jgi:pyrimidine operon attenuation protein/uracil phosphoribosyltransferase
MPPSQKLLDAQAINRALSRMAHEIVEINTDNSRLALVGIHTHGVPLAQRLAARITEIVGASVACGTLDIGMHRDDIGLRGGAPVIHKTEVPFDISGKSIVLVDDVLFTGRTIRAAMDALMDLGRPQRIQLAVLVDRGHRELPIRPDYVGKNLPTKFDEKVQVRLRELDATDEVTVSEKVTS